MTIVQMFAMWLGILLGFICVVVAAAGYRKGWPQKKWLLWAAAAVFFLTVVPVVTALTMGLSSGLGPAPLHTGDK